MPKYGTSHLSYYALYLYLLIYVIGYVYFYQSLKNFYSVVGKPLLKYLKNLKSHVSYLPLE